MYKKIKYLGPRSIPLPQSSAQTTSFTRESFLLKLGGCRFGVYLRPLYAHCLPLFICLRWWNYPKTFAVQKGSLFRLRLVPRLHHFRTFFKILLFTRGFRSGIFIGLLYLLYHSYTLSLYKSLDRKNSLVCCQVNHFCTDRGGN